MQGVNLLKVTSDWQGSQDANPDYCLTAAAPASLFTTCPSANHSGGQNVLWSLGVGGDEEVQLCLPKVEVLSFLPLNLYSTGTQPPPHHPTHLA